MKHLGKLVILLLLAANLVVTGLLLATAYSPYLQPTQHPVLSCLGLAFPIFLLLNTACLLCWIIVQQYKCALLPLAGLLLHIIFMEMLMEHKHHGDHMLGNGCPVSPGGIGKNRPFRQGPRLTKAFRSCIIELDPL